MCNYFFSYITANLNYYCIKVKKIFVHHKIAWNRRLVILTLPIS